MKLGGKKASAGNVRLSITTAAELVSSPAGIL